mgnify:CR=1 FL=1
MELTDGISDGAADGLVLGCDDGKLEGMELTVGVPDGAADGLTLKLGLWLGDTLGRPDGNPLGLAVGYPLGKYPGVAESPVEVSSESWVFSHGQAPLQISCHV